jgi:hypothetical protein
MYRPKRREQNMFDKVGFYRTRDGQIAEVLTVVHPAMCATYPLLGRVGDSKRSWKDTGREFDARMPGDLVEYLGTTKPKQKKMVTKTVEYWMNFYGSGYRLIYSSKELADRAATPERIACVKLTGTYEVEEEVDE